MEQPTYTDYQQTLAEFVQRIDQLGENGQSVLLYGSMARDDIIPGHSDLDFWVIVQEAAFHDLDRFQDMFDAFVQAGMALADSKLPVIHAFCYYADDELHLLPQALVPNLRAPRSSRIVWGRDMRPQMDSTPASRELHRTSYFMEMRQQVFLPLYPYLHKAALTAADCKQIVGSLKYIKYIAEAACAALDLWPGELAAISQLDTHLPQVDTRIIAIVEAFRTRTTPTYDPDEVQAMLRQALSFVEDVHAALVEMTRPIP